MALPAHNLCTNPAASVDLTGWGGTASPFRDTGLTGAERSTGIQATANGYLRSAAGAVVPGQDYSVSFSGKLAGPGATGTLGTTYWVWYDSGLSDLSYLNWGGWPNSDPDTWYRHSATATAPEGAAYLGVIQDVGVFGPVLTALLIEAGAVAHDYADGDTSGWAWDGTTGLSSSQPSGTTGVLAGATPAPSGALAATLTDSGVLAGITPAPSGALTASLTDGAALAGTTPAPTGALTATLTDVAALAGTTPAPAGALAASMTVTGALAGTTPAPAGTLFATPPNGGVLAGTTPAPSGALAAALRIAAALAGTTPAPFGSLTDLATTAVMRAVSRTGPVMRPAQRQLATMRRG